VAWGWLVGRAGGIIVGLVTCRPAYILVAVQVWVVRVLVGLRVGIRGPIGVSSMNGLHCPHGCSVHLLLLDWEKLPIHLLINSGWPPGQ